MIVILILLKCWLRKKHLIEKYIFVIQQTFKNNSTHHLFEMNFIVYCYDEIVQFVLFIEIVTMNRVNMQNFFIRVKFVKTHFQIFLQIVIVNKTQNNRIENRAIERDRKNLTKIIDNATSSKKNSMKFMMFVYFLESNSFSIKNVNFDKIVFFATINFRNEVDDDLIDDIINKFIFLRIIQRFNIHVSFHYSKIIKKFETSWNVNTFIKKNKHRFWKNQIKFTNDINVEKTFMLKKKHHVHYQIFFIKCFQTKWIKHNSTNSIIEEKNFRDVFSFDCSHRSNLK